jgi:septal ring factor EnvC (AmiA/AmiB activator)
MRRGSLRASALIRYFDDKGRLHILDITQFKPDQFMLATGAACFVVGVILTILVKYLSGRNPAYEDPRNHRIRELEADLRATRKSLTEKEQALEQKSTECTAAVCALQELKTTLTARDKRISDLNSDLQGALEKINDLRRELQDRAAERVHERIRAEAAVTELEVERAGSEAVMTEITRLQQEREELTARMQKLGGIMLLDDELFGSENS